MVKREITRIVIMVCIGLIIAVAMIIRNGENINKEVLILLPLYITGLFYTGTLLLKSLCFIIKTYCSCQFVSLLSNPLWGTIISVVLLFLGIMTVLSFGWVIGIFRCIYCLITAYQFDRQYNEMNNIDFM